MLSQSQIMYAWGPRCTGPYATISLHGTGKVTVKAAATEAVKALDACLKTWDYRTIYSQTGAQNCRRKVSGVGWSIHAYGAAMDINWQLNPYGGSRYDIPSSLAAAICAIRTKNGKQVWNWGGYWRGTRDWMHFEIVCSPGDIATGINWSTVAGVKSGPSNPPIYVPPTKPIPPEEDIMASKQELQDLLNLQNQWTRDELTRTVKSLVQEIRSGADEDKQNQWIRDELSRQTSALTKEIRAQNAAVIRSLTDLTEAVNSLNATLQK